MSIQVCCGWLRGSDHVGVCPGAPFGESSGLQPCNAQEYCASNKSRPTGHNKTGVDCQCVIADVGVHRGGSKCV
jgi:hypothetical protein